MRSLSVKIRQCNKKNIIVNGVGLSGLHCPKRIFLGNSGTTYRLLAGLLAAQEANVILQAGDSLSRRPMKRIVEPLIKMGARLEGRTCGTTREIYPPLIVKGGRLKAITYRLPIASAQVKSAILLAALYARGKTTVIEPAKSRDHTERMLYLFKAPLSLKGKRISLRGPVERLMGPNTIVIPGDFSSAAFFIVAALLLPGSKITLKCININPTRTGLLTVLRRMGAKFSIIPATDMKWPHEPTADIAVRYSQLRATQVMAQEIPLLIDELPVFMVAASLSKGTTRIKGIGELRFKETDRIQSMSFNLRRMGVSVGIKRTAGGEDLVVRGVDRLRGSALNTFGDHRTAMALVIAGLCAKSESILNDVSCVKKSFPDFFQRLDSITVG
jgi:3-phosphoshikimate 1-carboxyvinyltransferase